MTTMEKKIEKSFFVIASDMDLSSIPSRLYGICYTEERIYKDVYITEDYFNMITDKESGCFTAVKNRIDKITLEQDCCFSLYLYYYQNNDYWAVSNSFWKLCHEVKKHYPLTIDDTFFEQYFSMGVTPLSLNRTFANEIKVCPYGYRMEIDILARKLIVSEHKEIMDKLIHKTPLDSKEAVEKLDQWISKWASIIRGIDKSGCVIKFDLTGGFDSRISFALAVASGINLDDSKVQVYSRKGYTTEGNVIEDYQIASQIAEEFGFKLSEEYSNKNAKRICGKDAYEIYYHALSNMHREPYQPRFYNPKPVFYLNGLNGEVIRGWKQRDGFVEAFRYPIGVSSKHFFPVSAWKEIISDWEALPDFSEDEEINETEKNRYFMLAVRSKTHMASVMYQNNILNYWQVTNFADVDMLNVQTPKGFSPTVLMAVILSRIDKRLLSIPVSDGRSFSQKEIEYAEYILEKYPANWQIQNQELKLIGEEVELDYNIDLRNDTSPEKILCDIFHSEEGKKQFIDYFGELGEMLYNDAEINHIRKDISFPYQYIAAVGVTMEMLSVQKESRRYYGENMVRDDLNSLKELVERCPDNIRIQLAYKNLQESTINKHSHVAQKDVDILRLEKLLDEKHSVGQKVALWGCGIRGKKWLDLLEKNKIGIDYVIDENPELQGKVINGYVVNSYKEVKDKVDVLLVTIKNQEIVSEIRKIVKDKIVFEQEEW